jgi:hypothetical protein
MSRDEAGFVIPEVKEGAAISRKPANRRPQAYFAPQMRLFQMRAVKVLEGIKGKRLTYRRTDKAKDGEAANA